MFFVSILNRFFSVDFLSLLLTLKCCLIRSASSTDSTSNETDIETQSINNQLLEFVPSNTIYYSIILNIVFGFYLIQTVTRDRGCKLSNGIQVPNGWEKLFKNCQEKCICQKNKLSCAINQCDLSKNKCVNDLFGDSYCQGAILMLSTYRLWNKPTLVNLNGKNKSTRIAYPY